MRAWLLAGAVGTVAACGGNVVVDGPGSGGAGVGGSVGDTSGSVGDTSGSVGDTSGSVGGAGGVGGIGTGLGGFGTDATSTGSGTTAMCVASCAYAAFAHGGEPCVLDTSAEATYEALVSCLAAYCPTECPTFLAHASTVGADATCPMCMKMACDCEFIACGNN